MGDITTFDRFWSAYPRKVSKGQAKKKWDSLTKGMEASEAEEFLIETVNALDAQKRNRAELERAGEFVPPWKHPTTWLNGECWNDELKSLQEIREKTQTPDPLCQCGRKAFISMNDTWLCCWHYSEKYSNNGPTGLNALRQEYKRAGLPRQKGEGHEAWIGRLKSVCRTKAKTVGKIQRGGAEADKGITEDVQRTSNVG